MMPGLERTGPSGGYMSLCGQPLPWTWPASKIEFEGSKLNIHPVHAEREAASLAGAGPRATPCAAAGDPGRLCCFLVVNFLAVPFLLLARLVCRVESSETVLCASRVTSVSEWW